MKTIAYSFLALCLTVSPGLAQTYVTLSGSYSDYTLQSGTTYYISNSVILTGTTVIEGGAVVKYAANKSLTIGDAILCQTSPQRPAYFTAKDDDTVGDMIAGSSGSPGGYYAATALRLPAAGGSVLSHLRFRYARTAVAVGSLEDGVYPEDVLECLEFQHCDSGVAVTGPDGSQTESFVGGSQTSGIGGGGGGDGLHARGVELLNTLFSEGSQVITGRVAHVNVFWLTVDQAAYVAYGSDVDVLVRESVLASVSHAGGGGAAISGSYNGYYHSTNAAFGTSPNYVTTNYPFQSLGGNAYYLTNGSPFVDAGGETAMEAGLDIFTTQTNQLTDVCLVDLGYHYSVLPGNLVVSTNVTPQQMAEWLVPPWVTVTNASFTGTNDARGVFTNGASCGFPIERGVILSSGEIATAVGTNDNFFAGTSFFSNNDPDNSNDSDLDKLVGNNGTHDAAVLEFDLIATNSFMLQFQYTYASEEYPEWIAAPQGSFNDPMAIFVSTNFDGTNWVNNITNDIALVPGISLPVMVGNINGGCTPNDITGYITPINPQYYVDNCDPHYQAATNAAPFPVYNLQYDGFTTLFTVQTNILPNMTYHIKIAIADYGDNGIDSAVFLKAQLSCP